MTNPDEVIWLSHVLSSQTPAYGGESGFEQAPLKQLICGDSCNASMLRFANHLGSHVDAPFHFIAKGKKVDEYEPKDWIFSKPLLIDVPLNSSEIIDESFLDSVIASDNEIDLILFRTGFELHRHEVRYWEAAPGFAPGLAGYLKSAFPELKAIGMDTLSLTSYQHRELGREAHKAFLGLGLRIFEDLSLMNIPSKTQLKKVIALPLRYQESDGSPCTLIAWVRNE